MSTQPEDQPPTADEPHAVEEPHPVDGPQPVDEPDSPGAFRVLFLTVVVEGFLLLLALVFGWYFGFHWRQVPPEELTEPVGAGTVITGILAGLILFCGAILLEKIPVSGLRNFSEEVARRLQELFAGVPLWGLLLVSLCAGLCEEMLFRWCLQGGLETWIGWPLALVVASVVFGVCHWLNATYAVLATFAGFYMGGLMLVSESVVVPIIAHTAYDFVALVWITRIR